MSIATWLDRITDETNVWFSAVKAEEGGDLAAAATLYLKDASAFLSRGSAVRAGLSCYCAADCLAKAGEAEVARALYLEAGLTYSYLAQAKMSDSVRESMWALQRAYACYVYAEEPKRAEEAKAELAVLGRRANPFVGGSAIQVLEEPACAPPRAAERTVSPDDAELKAALEAFLLTSRMYRSRKDELRYPRRVDSLDEKDIVSQLG